VSYISCKSMQCILENTSCYLEIDIIFRSRALDPSTKDWGSCFHTRWLSSSSPQSSGISSFFLAYTSGISSFFGRILQVYLLSVLFLHKKFSTVDYGSNFVAVFSPQKLIAALW
jgi:hypothetical protein